MKRNGKSTGVKRGERMCTFSLTCLAIMTISNCLFWMCQRGYDDGDDDGDDGDDA